ncbi:MAG: bifunctional 5,10-methylenetetrahydrofolate dehydrogenase/5,10-methenyltetrahydrofolate cyclohydrolase [Microgenomates group bacterium]
MILLEGQKVASQIIENLKTKDLSAVSLHIILVGQDQNSLKYVSLKQNKCQELGIKCIVHHLPEITPTPDLITLIQQLNTDPAVTGFFIQLPLPPHIDKNKILSQINPLKDVDGLTPASRFTPAVVRGVITLLDAYHLSFAEKTAVIINDTNLIGIPLKKILEQRKCRVIICNEFTKNVAKISRGADYIFSATGVKGLVTADYIKPSAVVVDIGGGDVNFVNVSALCSYITPTFGGVGPLTIACLLQNLGELL